MTNKLVDDLKCENESLKMHELFDWEPTKNEEVLCCNLVVKPNFVPIVSSISNEKWLHIPPHKRNHKWRERLLSQNLGLGLILGIWMDLSLFLLATIAV